MQNLNSLLAHDFGLIGPPALNGDSGACHCQKVITLLCRWPPGPEGLRVRRLVSQSREVFVCLRPLVGFLSGAGDSRFPPWLKSLMTICCCVTDCYLQNVAISTLLEVINHSQSLALVIEDKMKRYKSSGHNPFFGKLQMVTVPPIAPGILKVIAEKTDFYQVFPTGKRKAGTLRPSSQTLSLKLSLRFWGWGGWMCVCVCVYAVSCSVMSNSLPTPWSVTHPGSSVHGILQARILEGVAIPFSRGSSQPSDQNHVSCISSIDRQILYRCATWEGLRFW